MTLREGYISEEKNQRRDIRLNQMQSDGPLCRAARLVFLYRPRKTLRSPRRRHDNFVDQFFGLLSQGAGAESSRYQVQVIEGNHSIPLADMAHSVETSPFV